MIFASMILLHLLYDFHWQGPFIAEMKGQSWFLLGVHALTWSLLLAVPLAVAGTLAWWHVPFLFATHFGIDAWKARKTRLAPLGIALWIDQAAHVITLIIVACSG